VLGHGILEYSVTGAVLNTPVLEYSVSEVGLKKPSTSVGPRNTRVLVLCRILEYSVSELGLKKPCISVGPLNTQVLGYWYLSITVRGWFKEAQH